MCKSKFKFMVCLVALAPLGMVSAESLRDPTRPLGHTNVSSPAAAQQTLRLQSVLISDTRKIAFINGQQVREQDVIKNSGNVQVVRIEAGGVIVQQGGKRWRLELNNVAIRQ